MFSLIEARRLGVFQVALVVLVLSCFIAGSSMSVQAGELRAAPVNPEFKAYVQNRSLGLVQSLSEEGYPLGYIPPPLKLPRVNTTTVLAAAALCLRNTICGPRVGTHR